MNSKDIYEQLALKFSYLSNLKPAGVKQKFTLFDNILSESFVHDYNPSRYAFYMELMKAFQKPDVLKNVIYENKLIKSKQEDLDEIYNKITKKLNALYRVDENELKDKTGKDYDNEYNKLRNKNITEANTQIAEKVNQVVKNNYPGEKFDEMKTVIDETFGIGVKNMSGGAPSRTSSSTSVALSDVTASLPPVPSTSSASPDITNDIIKEFEKKKKGFYNDDGFLKYKNRLEEIKKKGDISYKVKAQMYKDVLTEFEDDPIYSINNFKLTKEDKLVFIFVTFIIRLLSLMIIDWSLTSNFVVNFYQAYLLYIGLYCIFLLLILVIVNMTYTMSLQDVGKENSFAVTLASSMYFFYFVPGKRWSSSLRIIVHLSVIILMTLISLFIVSGSRNQEGTINYNYSEKKFIKRQLNNFTLILWLFTSFLAMTFKVS
jgi:hypothetical protein